jgi:type IV pilus assembly protein PilA
MRQNKGFSLVELMIVVAIIGILAAIAIPNFVAMQYRSKRAELPSNVTGIKTAELAYDASQDSFINVSSPVPRDDGNLDKQATQWIASDFDKLSWSPDGDVRGNYMVTTTSGTDFMVTAKIDVDDDNVIAQYTCSRSSNSVQVSQNDTY